jgi:hypothetical protein
MSAPECQRHPLTIKRCAYCHEGRYDDGMTCLDCQGAGEVCLYCYEPLSECECAARGLLRAPNEDDFET